MCGEPCSHRGDVSVMPLVKWWCGHARSSFGVFTVFLLKCCHSFALDLFVMNSKEPQVSSLRCGEWSSSVIPDDKQWTMLLLQVLRLCLGEYCRPCRADIEQDRELKLCFPPLPKLVAPLSPLLCLPCFIVLLVISRFGFNLVFAPLYSVLESPERCWDYS